MPIFDDVFIGQLPVKNAYIDLVAGDDSVENVFCPTGPGGGVDPTCKPGSSGGSSGSADSYFEPKELKQVGGYKSRDILVHMTPDLFLSIADKGHDAYKEATVKRVIESGEKFPDLPHIGFRHDGKGVAVVVSHEGRHRAMAFKKLGITSMPVVLRSIEGGTGSGIRWSEQGGPGSSFDRISGEWPRILVGQDNRHTVPFPVSDMREDVVENVLSPIASSTFQPETKRRSKNGEKADVSKSG